MPDRFFYQTGFIKEKVNNKDKIIADFFGGCVEISPQLIEGTKEKRDRIIRLLNLGYEQEQKGRKKK